MSHTLLISKMYTIFKDVQMMLKWFFDISTGFRFSKNQCECSVHICSCPCSRLKLYFYALHNLKNIFANSFLPLKNKIPKWQVNIRNPVAYFCDRLNELSILMIDPKDFLAVQDKKQRKKRGTKGQLILKGHFGAFKSTKNPTVFKRFLP